MFKKIFLSKRILLVLDIILLIVSIASYVYVFKIEKNKTEFINDAIKFAEESQNPIFRISEITLYSSAYAIDNSEDKTLQDINISQFTDIALKIDNKGKSDEITAENTISELFIDNIKVSIPSEKGEHILNYKNPKFFGKYQELSNYQEDGIWFKIAHSNDDQLEIGYDNSVFFTDCSNPISLGFVNKDLLTNCAIGNVDGEILFDGSILRNANVDLEDVHAKISFTIHLRNNLDESFVCNVDIDNSLEDAQNSIYSGYIMKIHDTDGMNYNFFKVSE